MYEPTLTTYTGLEVVALYLATQSQSCKFLFVGTSQKTLVYTTPIETDELLACILTACNVIHDMPGIFEQVQHSFLHCCTAYTDVGGDHFELLKQ